MAPKIIVVPVSANGHQITAYAAEKSAAGKPSATRPGLRVLSVIASAVPVRLTKQLIENSPSLSGFCLLFDFALRAF